MEQQTEPDDLRRLRQELLEEAVEQSPVIYYIADWGSSTDIRYVSANVESLTGKTADEVTATPRFWRRNIHPDDLAKYSNRVSSLGPDKRSTLKYRFKVWDGDYRWFRDRILRRPRPDGSGDDLIGCMIEITVEMDRLAEFGGMKSLHTTIVDTAPFAIVAVDEGGRIVEFNTAAERMFRYQQDEVLGRQLEETIIPERHHAAHQRSLARIRDHGGRLRANRRMDVEAKRANGTLFPVSIVVGQAVSDERSVFVAVITDTTAQVAAEEERHRLDQLLRDAVDSLSEGFALYDADDRLVMCNEQYRDYHQIASDVLAPGVEWSELIRTEAQRGLYPAAEGHDTDDWVRNWIKARRTAQSPLEYGRADGRWFIGSNRKTRQGGAVVTLNEITELKEREAELREAHELLEDAIESLSEGFALWDEDDRLVMCNQTYRDFNELCVDILKPGVKWLDFVRAGAERGQYADAIGRIDSWLEQSIADRRALRANHEYEISDGRWCIGSNRSTRHGGIVVTRIDITDRKNMEKALQESEAFNRQVLDSCPVAVQMTQTETGKVVYRSPASAALFGQGDGESDTYASNFFIDQADYHDCIDRLRREGQFDDVRAQLRRRDGSSFWGSISAKRVSYQGDDFTVSTTFDLTERLETEEELERQRSALHQSEKMTALGSLLAGVAHELNNPLTVVIGRAMMLEEAFAGTQHADAVSKLRAASERCSKIVQTFLSMARQKEPSRRAERIDRIVEAAMEIVGYGMRADSIEVTIDLNHTLPEIACDASQMIQVFTNLFVNAQQALVTQPLPRTIDVSGHLAADGKSVAIDVRDNGPGIPDEILSRIFDPFFTTREKEQGTGLGLSVSLGLIRAHGGTIDVNSTQGAGTVFSIQMPVDKPVEHVEEAPVTSSPDSKPGNILIVEDESEIAVMLAEFLEPLGHHVTFAETGRVALDRVAAEDFDLILTDLRMPDLNGRELYAELQRRAPDLAARTVFVTGDTLSGNFEQFLSEAGRPVIEKPFTPHEIREIVSAELNAANGAGSLQTE